MNLIEKLIHKKKKLVIGLMSGTSADGIDTAIVEIIGKGLKTKHQLIDFYTYPYPKGFRKKLIELANSSTVKLDELVRINILVGKLFAESVKQIIKDTKLEASKIDLIGSHGQTVRHLPESVRMYGRSVRATYQIGDPVVIAKETGIVTVGDFRIADIAVGGSGAPLIPYFDYLVFHSNRKSRGLLNIGGIANITILPKSYSLKKCFAFDIGPGNMLIDGLMQRLYKKHYDMNGAKAYQGKVQPEILRWLNNNSYFQLHPPKSTGREDFGNEFIDQILKKFSYYPKVDLITTVTEFVPLLIYQSYLRFIKPMVNLDELIVSGGGVHNRYIMNSLHRYFHPIAVKTSEDFGFSSDAKEAICFAVLANETISGNPTNIPAVTGASRQTVLGKICLP